MDEGRRHACGAGGGWRELIGSVMVRFPTVALARKMGAGHIPPMASTRIKQPIVRASDLPTKTVRAADGTAVRVKVVQANSPTLDLDLLAAFRANVRRIKADQRKRLRVVGDSTQG